MKTSKHITEVDYPNLNGKFAVVRQSGTMKRMAFTNVHDEVLSATEEAERLNLEFSRRFMVVKIIATVGY